MLYNLKVSGQMRSGVKNNCVNFCCKSGYVKRVFYLRHGYVCELAPNQWWIGTEMSGFVYSFCNCFVEESESHF